MAVRNILVPVDFSQHSGLAARVGVALARRLDAGVRLIHALDLRPRLEIEPEVQESFEAAVMSRTRDAMRRLVLELADGVELSSAVVRGEVGAALLAAASDPPASLIVIGSSGKAEAEPLHLGSVAARLVREASCPVLVLRAKHAERLSGDGWFHRPLVAVDYSRFTEVAIECAARLAAPGVPIELLHALFVPTFEVFPSGEVDKMYAGAFAVAAQKERRRLEAEAERAGIANPIIATVEMGRAAELISARLEKQPFDLVVTGAHGRESSADLLIGSVADHLLRRSPAPVLFIPDAAAPDSGP